MVPSKARAKLRSADRSPTTPSPNRNGPSNDHNELDLTDRIIRQGRALVRAIESLTTIDPSGPFERAIAGLLVAAYKRRLRGIVELVPDWVAEEILSVSEGIGDDRAALWMSEN